MEIEELKKNIAGDIVLSENPGETIKKWRLLFQVSQQDISKKLNISSSVISDYETGRRKSPGIKLIEKIIDALIDIDLNNGGKNVKEFSSLYGFSDYDSFVISKGDFKSGVRIKTFLKKIFGKLCYDFENIKIYGYYLIDSKKAIVNFSPMEIGRVAGLINSHCIIFTNLDRGRSPLISIRLANLRPGLIVLHGINKVDDMALRIAKLDRVPLAISYIANLDKLIRKLKEFNK